MAVAARGLGNTRTQHHRMDHGEEEEQSALYADNKEERQLTIPSYVASDGRHRHAASARYDGVFGAGATEDDGHVYDAVGAPLVKAAQKGESACLFAYGQTGTGKSHNIWNVLLPRAANALLDGGAPAIEVACVQLYNDRIDDLLAAYPATPQGSAAAGGGLSAWAAALGGALSPSSPSPPSRSATSKRPNEPSGGALPPSPPRGLALPSRTGAVSDPLGMRWITCRSAADVESVLSFAAGQRVVGATGMNAASSRSHTAVYFQLTAASFEGFEGGAAASHAAHSSASVEGDADDASSSTTSAPSLSMSSQVSSAAPLSSGLSGYLSSGYAASGYAASAASTATSKRRGGGSGGGGGGGPRRTHSSASLHSSLGAGSTSSDLEGSWCGTGGDGLVPPFGGGGGGGGGGSRRAASSAALVSRTSGRLVIVDLAGSERLKKSGSEGDAKREAVAINSSLHALAQTIQALSRRAEHVPTRDSRLTRLLDAQLRGGALLHLLVCVSPLAAHLQETSCSLDFARRAMRIQSVPVPPPPRPLDLITLSHAQRAGGGAPSWNSLLSLLPQRSPPSHRDVLSSPGSSYSRWQAPSQAASSSDTSAAGGVGASGSSALMSSLMQQIARLREQSDLASRQHAVEIERLTEIIRQHEVDKIALNAAAAATTTTAPPPPAHPSPSIREEAMEESAVAEGKGSTAVGAPAASSAAALDAPLGTLHTLVQQLQGVLDGMASVQQQQQQRRRHAQSESQSLDEPPRGASAAAAVTTTADDQQRSMIALLLDKVEALSAGMTGGATAAAGGAGGAALPPGLLEPSGGDSGTEEGVGVPSLLAESASMLSADATPVATPALVGNERPSLLPVARRRLSFSPTAAPDAVAQLSGGAAMKPPQRQRQLYRIAALGVIFLTFAAACMLGLLFAAEQPHAGRHLASSPPQWSRRVRLPHERFSGVPPISVAIAWDDLYSGAVHAM